MEPISNVAPVSSESVDSPSSSLTSLQTHRGLISWMSEQEQVQTILGRLPLPTEDITELNQAILAYKAARLSRETFTSANPIIEIDDMVLQEKITTRPSIQILLARGEGRPVMVDLKKVLAFQKTVRVDDLDARISPALTDLDQLLELCFPSVPSIDIGWERDDNGYTITSSNPNFGVVPNQMPVTINEVLSFPFLCLPNLNCLMVVRFRDRYFIRDGYHRAVGLLHEGKDIVPCMLAEAQDFSQTGWRPGMIDQQLLVGEYPPRLTDFWDDEVSRSFLRQAKKRVYRIRLDVFDVAA